MSIPEYISKVAIPVFFALNYFYFLVCLGCSALYAGVNDKEKRKENFKSKFIEYMTDISEILLINFLIFAVLLWIYMAETI